MASFNKTSNTQVVDFRCLSHVNLVLLCRQAFELMTTFKGRFDQWNTLIRCIRDAFPYFVFRFNFLHVCLEFFDLLLAFLHLSFEPLVLKKNQNNDQRKTNEKVKMASRIYTLKENLAFPSSCCHRLILVNFIIITILNSVWHVRLPRSIPYQGK